MREQDFKSLIGWAHYDRPRLHGLTKPQEIRYFQPRLKRTVLAPLWRMCIDDTRGLPVHPYSRVRPGCPGLISASPDRPLPTSPAIQRSESMLNHGRQIPTRRSSSKKRSAIGLSGKSVRYEKPTAR